VNGESNGESIGENLAMNLLVDVSIAAAARLLNQSDKNLPTSTITAQSSFPELERIEHHGHGDEAVQDE
jgi:hypothetical protein